MVSGRFQTGVQRLPQLLRQTSGFLTRELDAGQVGDKSGADPAIAVASAAMALTDATTAAAVLEAALASAQNTLTNLYQPGASLHADDGGREEGRLEWWEQNAPTERAANALPPESAAPLARLLGVLDEFLRSAGIAARTHADDRGEEVQQQ
ncbi:MAG: hypothetical protein ACREOE_16100 [Gemmatimonadales bacterium]